MIIAAIICLKIYLLLNFVLWYCGFHCGRQRGKKISQEESRHLCRATCEAHLIPFVHTDVSYTNDEVSDESVQEMLSRYSPCVAERDGRKQSSSL